jgi:hypothetical protein
LQVLRQTSGRAAGQAPIRPFHFRQTQSSHSNSSGACIGISLAEEKMNDENQANERPITLTAPACLTVPGFASS